MTNEAQKAMEKVLARWPDAFRTKLTLNVYNMPHNMAQKAGVEHVYLGEDWITAANHASVARLQPPVQPESEPKRNTVVDCEGKRCGEHNCKSCYGDFAENLLKAAYSEPPVQPEKEPTNVYEVYGKKARIRGCDFTVCTSPEEALAAIMSDQFEPPVLADGHFELLERQLRAALQKISELEQHIDHAVRLDRNRAEAAEAKLAALSLAPEALVPKIKHIQGLANDEVDYTTIRAALEDLLKEAYRQCEKETPERVDAHTLDLHAEIGRGDGRLIAEELREAREKIAQLEKEKK